MLEFKHVSKLYNGGFPAIEDVSFKVEEGEFLSIVGHSGAGKSTILKLILAEITPSKGEVIFAGKNIHKMRYKDLLQYRRKIGVIFQDFRLLPSKTVFENIAFVMEAIGKSNEEILSDVPYVLELVDLQDKADYFPKELSGGEQQRVAIARAIINQPDLIIADEPTGNLDPVSTYEIVQILKKINELGTTVILTTHNKGIIDNLKKRVITMDCGKIVRDDPVGYYSL